MTFVRTPPAILQQAQAVETAKTEATAAVSAAQQALADVSGFVNQINQLTQSNLSNMQAYTLLNQKHITLKSDYDSLKSSYDTNAAKWVKNDGTTPFLAPQSGVEANMDGQITLFKQVKQATVQLFMSQDLNLKTLGATASFSPVIEAGKGRFFPEILYIINVTQTGTITTPSQVELLSVNTGASLVVKALSNLLAIDKLKSIAMQEDYLPLLPGDSLRLRVNVAEVNALGAHTVKAIVKGFYSSILG